MALFDFTKPAAHPAASSSRRPDSARLAKPDQASAFSPSDASEALESLSQLRLALDFAAARQALTRKHLVQAQAKRDRWYQQAQFAQRAESRILKQRAQRRDQNSNEAIAQLQVQLTDQTEQIASLEERILAIQDQLAQVAGFAASPPSDPCSALMPPGLLARFTGQIEL